MRCQSRVGGSSAAIAAFNGLGGAEKIPPELHAELGVAYSGLGDREKAVDAYQNALRTERKSILALRNLLELYVNSGAGEDLRRLVKQHEADIHGNTDCVQLLGLDCLKRGDLDGSFDMFRKCLSLTRRVERSEEHTSELQS